MNKSTVRDISETPEGRDLEAPLIKRRRKSQQSYTAPSPAPSSSIAPSSAPSSSNAAPFLASGIVPSSSEMIMASGESDSAPRPHRGGYLNMWNEENKCFIGSDAEQDDSSDDEYMMCTHIPRVSQSFMETPLDEDSGEDSEPDTDPAPPATDPEPAYQPRNLYDFDWRVFPNPQIQPELRREAFSQSNVGPTVPFGEPYDIFIGIWDRQIMEHMALETNKYAQQLAELMFDNHTLQPNSPISQWYDTTVDELYVYFALVFLMGVMIKCRLEDYWNDRDIFYNPTFSKYMSHDRFILLDKCLHFNDNNDIDPLESEASTATLFKIQPVLSHLNKKFQDMYTLSQNICLDESLLMWKRWGRRTLCDEYIPYQGIQTYEIWESQTGYLWRFEVHTHKKSTPQLYEEPLHATIPSIVLRLTKGLEHKGYTLWMESFYNSPCLARRLKCLGFDCVGTLRTDRKFVPQTVHSLTDETMRPGQIAGLTSGDVDVMVWRNYNRVAMISTYHGSGRHTGRGSTKPIAILDYSSAMSALDKKDRRLAKYPINRNQSKTWYKIFFKRLVNVSVLNAYIIHQHNTSTLSHRDFRMSLIESLLSKHSTSLPTPTPT